MLFVLGKLTAIVRMQWCVQFVVLSDNKDDSACMWFVVCAAVVISWTIGSNNCRLPIDFGGFSRQCASLLLW